jgi:hypothetical protein
MPTETTALRCIGYVDTASLEISNGLRPEVARLVPNLASVIEQCSIIDGRAIQRLTAPKCKRAWCGRGVAVKKSERLFEAATQHMAHQLDGVAAPATATTIPNLLFEVDGKSITATTSGARTGPFATLTPKLQAKPGDGIPHRHVCREHVVSEPRHNWEVPASLTSSECGILVLRPILTVDSRPSEIIFQMVLTPRSSSRAARGTRYSNCCSAWLGAGSLIVRSPRRTRRSDQGPVLEPRNCVRLSDSLEAQFYPEVQPVCGLLLLRS